MHFHSDSLFSRQFMLVKSFSALYVVGLIVAHAQLPDRYVWEIAVFFSVAMNFTYPYAAITTGNAVSLEAFVSLFLIVLSFAGLFISPYCLITAIFLHGVWDLSKHRGMGVRFFSWYVLGCVVVDWFYAATLLTYVALYSHD